LHRPFSRSVATSGLVRLACIAAVCWLASLASPVSAATESPAAKAAPAPAWIQKSNEHAQVLLQVMAKFGPEQAGFFGVTGFDDKIMDRGPDALERGRKATEEAIATLEQRLASESDPAVRQDLEIMIKAARDNIRGHQLSMKYDLPYFNLSEGVFQGIRALLDDQVAAERRPAALVRLKRYAGMEKGYTPIAQLAQGRIREKLADENLRGPFKGELEKDLGTSTRYVEGIGKLFAKYKIEGYEQPYEALKQQLAAYDAFVKAELLPRARTDFRQPPEMYAFALEQVGVDMPVDELQSRAKVAFEEIQTQMQMLAPLVAREKGLKATDYRDVIRELKKDQLVGAAILPHYQARIKEIEEIIRREKIVTLPARDAQIELASEAESAAIPAPNMRPPRMIGNTGERGTFVLPLHAPLGTGGKEKSFDDFTFAAASWTLTAHEARPGHELQFAAIVEKGVSIARALFAMNSVNAEGWGLYAEAQIQPYEPLDGQLIALQHRLMRAARAYLDPGLQLGTITREDAYRVLTEEVMLSDAMATQEVERYTFFAPGQATAYFVGYNRLLELRADVERELGSRFDRKSFHDFVLAQGMLPPALLRKAVIDQYVPSLAQKSAR
jgi:uncharacterized protein (DUF885 family)